VVRRRRRPARPLRPLPDSASRERSPGNTDEEVSDDPARETHDRREHDDPEHVQPCPRAGEPAAEPEDEDADEVEPEDQRRVESRKVSHREQTGISAPRSGTPGWGDATAGRRGLGTGMGTGMRREGDARGGSCPYASRGGSPFPGGEPSVATRANTCTAWEFHPFRMRPSQSRPFSSPAETRGRARNRARAVSSRRVDSERRRRIVRAFMPRGPLSGFPGTRNAAQIGAARGRARQHRSQKLLPHCYHELAPKRRNPRHSAVPSNRGARI
jgi:hypothetical protein